MISNLRSLLSSDFGSKAGWLISLSAFERGIAVIQTVLIARALGITDYGIYGLLFGTIGFVASVIGLQLGLTATVHVAMYKDKEKEKAAAVISMIRRLGLFLSLGAVAVVLPMAARISEFLFGSPGFELVVSLGIVFVAATIICGIQDGVAQGFEVFGAIAKTKIATTCLSFALVYPAAKWMGIAGILLALLLGLALKYALLWRILLLKRAEYGIPAVGGGVSLKALIGRFALPSMAVSLVTGCATWVGTLQLSRQGQGFDAVAMVNTGLQWRGPVLLLAASLGGVAVPAFSRLVSSGNGAHVAKFRNSLLVLNGGGTIFLVGMLVALSVPILRAYGPGFDQGAVAFSLVLLSTVPTIIAGVFMQELVGSARMWRQFWIHVPFVVVLMVCFHTLIPRFGANGYAIALLAGGLVFMLSALVADRLWKPATAS
ncbi:MAG: oligosaccharide flippase family protein [Pseudoxanthomonas sp.]